MTDILLDSLPPAKPANYLEEGHTLGLLARHHRSQAHRHPLRAFHHRLFLHRRHRHRHRAARARHAARCSAQRRPIQPPVHAARHRHGVVFSGAVDSDHARQFSAAVDDRGTRSGVSPAQSLFLVPVRRRRSFYRLFGDRRRGRYRLDLLHAVLDLVLQQPRDCGGGRRVRRRIFVHRHGGQFHHHHAHAARAGHDLVPPAAVRVGDLCDQHRDGAGDAGAGHVAAADHGRAIPRRADLQPQ